MAEARADALDPLIITNIKCQRPGYIGKGTYPYNWINHHTHDQPGEGFIFISKNVKHPSAVLPDDEREFMVGCQCANGRCTMTCSCRGEQAYQYNMSGKIKKTAKNMTISECNDRCGCGPQCSNRVLQRGPVSPDAQLQIFHTGDSNKGWGLRTTKPIAKNKYICEYLGEVISEDVCEERGKRYDKQGASYLWTEEFEENNCDVEPFTIDAFNYGNVSRFVNHSCNPNMVAVSVFLGAGDLRTPRIGFFSRKKICAHDELTIDYGYAEKFWSKCGGCKCDKCKKTLPS